MEKKRKGLSLGIVILITLVLGVAAGILLRKNVAFTADYLKPLGTIYVNLLKLMVVPVVLFSIIDGMISLGSIRRVGSIGWKTLVFFLITTAVAIIIALAFAHVFEGAFPLLENAETFEPTKTKFMDVLVNIFPSNFLTPLLNSDMLPTIVIAILVGIGILLAGSASQKVSEAVHALYLVIMKIMGIVLWLTPVGVFCLMANTIAVNGASVLSALGIVLLVTYLAYIAHFVITYGFTLSVIAKLNPFRFLRGMFPAMVTAFSTTSSNATLPLTIECTTKLGASKDVSAFVLPLGCTINMDGAAIYMGVAAVFISKCYGIDLSFSSLAMIVITSTLASIGSAGVPGAALVMLAMVLESAGLPVDGIALVVSIDKLFDMGRTCLNVTGDSVCALAIDRIEKKRIAKKSLQ